ncbi:MAG: hypothetical protein L0216_18435 [Planctomycetales bacterium]|nr:hypothetical protein [Planctomycetales bacterium]
MAEPGADPAIAVQEAGPRPGFLWRVAAGIRRRRIGLLLGAGVFLAILGFVLPVAPKSFLLNDLGTTLATHWIWLSPGRDPSAFLAGVGTWGAILGPVIALTLALHGRLRIAWVGGAAGFLSALLVAAGLLARAAAASPGAIGVGLYLVAAGNVLALSTSPLIMGAEGRPPARPILRAGLPAIPLLLIGWFGWRQPDPLAAWNFASGEAAAAWRFPGWETVARLALALEPRSRSRMQLPWAIAWELGRTRERRHGEALLRLVERDPEYCFSTDTRGIGDALESCRITTEELLSHPDLGVRAIAISHARFWLGDADRVRAERMTLLRRTPTALRGAPPAIPQEILHEVMRDPHTWVGGDAELLIEFADEMDRSFPSPGMAWSLEGCVYCHRLAASTLLDLMADERRVARLLAWRGFVEKVERGRRAVQRGPERGPVNPPLFYPTVPEALRAPQLAAFRAWADANADLLAAGNAGR